MNKKTLILGALLIVLVILAYFYQGPLKKWQDNLGRPKNIFAKIDIAKIDRIEVISAGNAIILSRQDGIFFGQAQAKWKFNNSKDFYADPAIMSKVLESLGKVKASDFELVSNNPARKSEFQIDSAGLAVKVYQADKQVADLIIGGQTSDYGSSYVSTSASSAVYSVESDLRWAFEQAEWRDLTIFSSDQEKINKIRFQYPNREFTMELKNDKWSGILPEKFTVNKEKIGKILRIMSNLKAVEIPEQAFEDTGLDKHPIIIQASGEAIDNVLMIGEGRGGLYHAKRGNSDNIYLIDKSHRDELDRWIWQLK